MNKRYNISAGNPIRNFWALKAITCGIRRLTEPRDGYLNLLL